MPCIGAICNLFYWHVKIFAFHWATKSLLCQVESKNFIFLMMTQNFDMPNVLLTWSNMLFDSLYQSLIGLTNLAAYMSKHSTAFCKHIIYHITYHAHLHGVVSKCYSIFEPERRINLLNTYVSLCNETKHFLHDIDVFAA